MKYVLNNRNDIVGSFDEVEYISTYNFKLLNCDDNLIKFFELNYCREEITIGINRFVTYKYEINESTIFIDYSYKLSTLSSFQAEAIAYLNPKIISYERNKKLNKLLL